MLPTGKPISHWCHLEKMEKDWLRLGSCQSLPHNSPIPNIKHRHFFLNIPYGHCLLSQLTCVNSNTLLPSVQGHGIVTSIQTFPTTAAKHSELVNLCQLDRWFSIKRSTLPKLLVHLFLVWLWPSDTPSAWTKSTRMMRVSNPECFCLKCCDETFDAVLYSRVELLLCVVMIPARALGCDSYRP